MGDADAHVVTGAEVGREVLGGVAEGVSLPERASEERDPLADDHRLLRAEHVDVRRALSSPEVAVVERVRAQRVVVAWQEIYGYPDPAHRLEGLSQGVRTQAVVLEHIPSHDDELGLGLAGDLADAVERLKRSLRTMAPASPGMK